MNKSWASLSNEILSCEICHSSIPEVRVLCPPKPIYPEPPNQVNTLFVGVAPPRPGDHFYSNETDRLKIGLFAVLSSIGYKFHTIRDFIDAGYFLSHTAKCPQQGTWRANIKISMQCAPRILRQEIEILKPRSICILSKAVGVKVANYLFGNDLVSAKCFEFGQIQAVHAGNAVVPVLVTAQPVRGWGEKYTKPHLAALLSSSPLG
jgi:hypothetical protein